MSTEASVISGRRNWGIPKHLARFSFTPTEPGNKSSPVLVRVAHPATPDTAFFQAVISPGTAGRFVPPIPVSTGLISAPLAWASKGAYRAELVQPRLEPATPPSASAEDDRSATSEHGERLETLIGSESKFIVRPSAKGWASVSKMRAVAEAGEAWAGLGDGVGFPKIELALGGLGTKMDFTMVFPVPEVVP